MYNCALLEISAQIPISAMAAFSSLAVLLRQWVNLEN